MSVPFGRLFNRIIVSSFFFLCAWNASRDLPGLRPAQTARRSIQRYALRIRCDVLFIVIQYLSSSQFAREVYVSAPIIIALNGVHMVWNQILKSPNNNTYLGCSGMT